MLCISKISILNVAQKQGLRELLKGLFLFFLLSKVCKTTFGLVREFGYDSYKVFLVYFKQTYMHFFQFFIFR
jgi:hypothetical protein